MTQPTPLSTAHRVRQLIKNCIETDKTNARQLMATQIGAFNMAGHFHS